jgi:hypothetical protein
MHGRKLEWKVPLRFVTHAGISKAKALIGYSPKWGIEEMAQSSLVVKRGDSDR